MGLYQNYSERLVSYGGNSTTAVVSGAANTVIKAASGRLCRVVVTGNGTGAGNVQFYDNASTNSGTVIAAIPATVNAGTIYDFEIPAVNGIVCANVASGPALTVSFI